MVVVIYVKKNENEDFMIVCFYIDDLIYARTNKTMIENFKKTTMKEFEYN